MNIQKHYKAIAEVIKYAEPRYVYKPGHKNKWKDFLKKRVKKVVIEGPILDEEDPKEGRRFKYFNKRFRQLSKRVKILVCNDNFIEKVMSFAKEWSLYDMAFGIKDSNTGKFKRFLLNSEINREYRSLWKAYLANDDIAITRIVAKKMENPTMNKISKGLPSVVFNNKLEDFMVSFNLSLLWKESILLLFLTGGFVVPINLCPVILKDNGKKIDLYVPIFAETQAEDLKYNWDKIKVIKEAIYGKQKIKTSEDFDQYLKMYLGKKKGGKYLYNGKFTPEYMRDRLIIIEKFSTDEDEETSSCECFIRLFDGEGGQVQWIPREEILNNLLDVKESTDPQDMEGER